MGLGESEGSIDKGSAIACSICLEIVTGFGVRSTARLQCGHEFHLDCIGSAFNAKGVMQCPNCRKVEKGSWLYANGSRTMPALSFDERTHDEDLYDVSYIETTSTHGYPFSRLAMLPSFERMLEIKGRLETLVSQIEGNNVSMDRLRAHIKSIKMCLFALVGLIFCMFLLLFNKSG